MIINSINSIKFNPVSKLKSCSQQNPLLKTNFDSVSFTSKKISQQEAIEEFEKIDVKATIKDDGTLKLKNYEPHTKDAKKLSRSEDELFEIVSEIEGYANFENSKLTSTGALEEIGKSAIFSSSRIEEIPNLQYIGKDAYFNNSDIEDYSGLTIGRSAIIETNHLTEELINAVAGDKITVSDWGDGLTRIYNNDYER